MAEIEINDEVQRLLQDVNDAFPGEVRLHFGKERSGYVRHDQSNQLINGDKILVEVSDVTAPDYTASHELLHMLLALKGFPQLFFKLTTGDEDADQQLMFFITELYDVVAHEIVVSEQRKHGLIDTVIESLFLNGIHETITPEKKDEIDPMSTLRLLMMMNAIVFYGDKIDQYSAEFEESYPQAWQAALDIMTKLDERDIKTPLDFRRKVIKAFKLFDGQMSKWGVAELHSMEFATLGSVFSERQLRLTVRQLFQIFHADLDEKATKTRAYIGLSIGEEQQNAFVLPTPKNKQSDEYFRELYNKNVKDLFEELKMPYSIRQ
ncbi:hypothetical protein [Pediococcus claussenii]|uniref:IpaB/EvcA family protein n=1 Tax=Pediococcus claussenii (strain ATCC BAA-344 / DSM 14800 / JCM 18046 / KCTC 3811 / LMG 21948 / P06) TaxID=701521 RepID=G8PEF3_PEDCP|nr:hypothetical protein [Pediococcus claussenii]AEV94414.1 hypothetical protein PECL_86 [Pediococcus claussenii ATCC BAA-344]ANZ69635.1 IpaB/EvcA family protein [Pediococcus claussenii]ANZ71452.1 IpaB/EvcA family protein [Pediococcus claussenii]KRN19882.1 hypothetical protein IV79_GL001171 [Pediococcus claussenii]